MKYVVMMIVVLLASMAGAAISSEEVQAWAGPGGGSFGVPAWQGASWSSYGGTLGVTEVYGVEGFESWFASLELIPGTVNYSVFDPDGSRLVEASVSANSGSLESWDNWTFMTGSAPADFLPNGSNVPEPAAALSLGTALFFLCSRGRCR